MGRVSLQVGPFPPLGGGVEQEASRFELGCSLFLFFILFFFCRHPFLHLILLQHPTPEATQEALGFVVKVLAVAPDNISTVRLV